MARSANAAQSDRRVDGVVGAPSPASEIDDSQPEARASTQATIPGR